ncbi:MAG TPA: hypothetical protein VKT80_06595, partial [Chloroflexota bacterium]|nr:hypothetical protein [Chloroflexota bacterium]
SAPPPSDAAGVLAFVQAHAPDGYLGAPVNFYQTFANSVPYAIAFPNGGNAGLLPGFDLEVWGVPTSDVTVDPSNHNFIYLRFQRGILMYDASCACTEGVLLVDYLKSILTGQNLPSDLDAEARQSAFYRQYDSTQPGWVHDPTRLPNTDLTNAFSPTNPSSGTRVSINANLFPFLDQSKLRPGDIFKGQAVRYGTPEVPLNRATFLRGVNELNTISSSDTQRLGLSKEIVFSSIQDLQTYIDDPQLPGDVDYVEYDFEGVMTPSSEYGDPVGSAEQFADLAHSHGKMVTFAPIAGEFGQLQANGGLDTILSMVDVVVFQGQKPLLNLGTSGFTSAVQGIHSVTAGTRARLAVQLWTTINGCDTMVSVFNALQSNVDVVAIGTHDDGPGADCVLSALNR